MEQGKKAKVLCLHGFRTSGDFLKKQISKWHPSIFQQFDMVMPRTQRIWLIGLLSALFCAWTNFFLGFQVFPDGIFPAGGKSEIEGIFPPPYFEWFQNSSSIKYDLQIASDETTEISSYNGFLIPDFIFQLQFGHHHNLVCLSYSCQNSSMFDFFSAQEFTESTNLWMHFISVWLYGGKWTFWRPTWILPGKMKSNEATISEHLRIECPMFLWNLSLFSSWDLLIINVW